MLRSWMAARIGPAARPCTTEECVRVYIRWFSVSDLSRPEAARVNGSRANRLTSNSLQRPQRRAYGLLALRHVPSIFLGSAILIATLGAAPLGQTGTPKTLLSVVDTDDCPVRIQSAEIDPGTSAGLRVRYIVNNLHRKTIERVILTAATVNRDEQVTSIRIQTVEEPIDPQGRSEHFVVFTRLVPVAGERVVFGVQAVAWTGGREWRGVVRLASAGFAKAAR
jgi:hypothetical protein